MSDEPVRVHDFLPWAVKPPKAAGYWLEPVTCGEMTQNLGDMEAWGRRGTEDGVYGYTPAK